VLKRLATAGNIMEKLFVWNPIDLLEKSVEADSCSKFSKIRIWGRKLSFVKS